MNPYLKSIFKLVVICFLFASCHSFYFTKPQPVDGRNIYKLPHKYRGQWTGEGDTIILSKHYYSYTSSHNDSIPKTEADTSATIKIIDSLVYLFDENAEPDLIGAYPYTIKNDTVFYERHESLKIFFGSEAFFRKVHDGYILNTITESKRWWTCSYISKKQNSDIVITILNNDMVAKIPQNNFYYNSEYSHYLNVSWTKNELNKLIAEGYFLDTLIVLKKKKI
ncbi:MAG: hypothetical protein IPP71_07970 [Bacteroidetes bacterium]|nr:hypothetical protein [Bacteroidota bacterium]